MLRKGKRNIMSALLEPDRASSPLQLHDGNRDTAVHRIRTLQTECYHAVAYRPLSAAVAS